MNSHFSIKPQNNGIFALEQGGLTICESYEINTVLMVLHEALGHKETIYLVGPDEDVVITSPIHLVRYSPTNILVSCANSTKRHLHMKDALRHVVEIAQGCSMPYVDRKKYDMELGGFIEYGLSCFLGRPMSLAFSRALGALMDRDGFCHDDVVLAVMDELDLEYSGPLDDLLFHVVDNAHRDCMLSKRTTDFVAKTLS